jgi:hypothetical protein
LKRCDYLNQINENQKLSEEKISVEAIAKIFSNVEELYSIHTNIFNQLDDKMSDIQYLQKIEFCVTEIFSHNVMIQIVVTSL